MRAPAALLAAALVLWAAPAAAQHAELVMVERPGCGWCARWFEEIGPAYPNTPEGRRAPLRVVTLARPWPEDLADVARERFTPTFILMRDGVEAGRLRGYPGAEFFWHLLGEMLRDAGLEP